MEMTGKSCSSTKIAKKVSFKETILQKRTKCPKSELAKLRHILSHFESGFKKKTGQVQIEVTQQGLPTNLSCKTKENRHAIRKMKLVALLILLPFLGICQCQETKEILENINDKLLELKAESAKVAWESLVNPDNPKLPQRALATQKKQLEWTQKTCTDLLALHRVNRFNGSDWRQMYLLCRGPIFTNDDIRVISEINEELMTIYTNAEVCIPTKEFSDNLTQVTSVIREFTTKSEKYLKLLYYIIRANSDTLSIDEETMCFKGEEDFQKLMKSSRIEGVLRWTWLAWRELVGPTMKGFYKRLVNVENAAARRNGYLDIGAEWREELEMPYLREQSRELWNNVKPLYDLLHGIVRFSLRQKYGDVVPEKGPIPAHLLGNLWTQNWEPLLDLFVPNTIDFNKNIAKLNWTVDHMVKRAEDFYLSLGLPPMTNTFWNQSVFSKRNENTRCHGTAADMFAPGDFRVLYCSGTTQEDFNVLHHELGHIQYYMAYQNQPTVFRQANSAFQEAIGDTIMYGVMTPQHLHRLGLINDSLLYSTTAERDKTKTKKDLGINIFITLINAKVVCPAPKEAKTRKPSNRTLKKRDLPEEEPEVEDVVLKPDDIFLLKQALNKIPQIPFSLLLDEYRWEYFEEAITGSSINEVFWEMSLELQGIAPPESRALNDFDVGASFHIPDNTPHIRYFLSSFLQHQLFESLCKAAVFGRRGVRAPLPDSIKMNRCDIYGSKAAGKLLEDIMSRGHSQQWQQILRETTGHDNISSEALERYYKPLYKLLKKIVRVYNIPIGW